MCPITSLDAVAGELETANIPTVGISSDIMMSYLTYLLWTLTAMPHSIPGL